VRFYLVIAVFWRGVLYCRAMSLRSLIPPRCKGLVRGSLGADQMVRLR
jgi:hypothetical protein